MRTLPVPYISKLAIVLLLFLFPAPSTTQNTPPTNSLPLEVRSPYFNFWTPVSDAALSDVQYITQAFPGRTALVRIDGVTHSIFGQLAYATQTNVTGTAVTPTRTVFTFQIGPVALTVTFFSPIEPGDWVRQSTPFTYLAFNLEVTDGNTHDVQLYVHAVSENFFLADAGQPITWSTVSTGLCVYEMIQLQNQQLFSENANGQAEWGQYYLATAMSDGVTYGVGPADTLVNTFTTQGSLNTVPASSLNGTSDLSTALALSRNLGNVATNATAVFASGFVQDPAVQYVDPSGQSHLRVPYFKIQYSSIEDLIDAFIGDFIRASSRGLDLENQITFDSSGFPDDYYTTFLSMATRLAYASTVLTVEESSEGVLDPTDVMMFMKNIGAAVSPNRVNPAEVLYAAFSMFLYFDADLGGPLLEPLLRYQSSSSYLQPYAGLDAGTSYPNTSFSNAVHSQGVEQTANMLIMMYAYAQASGNGTIIETYYPLLTRWTEYLISTTLFTTNQVSGDLLNINNQTNLAIKGIIAIKAMSFISDMVGKSTNYSTTADTYYSRWTNLALGSDKHILAQYGHESSWSLGYNMFADLWLQTNVISQDVFMAHVNFLQTVTPGTGGIGIPLDSFRPDNVTFDSNMFAAGFADTTLLGLILSGMESQPISNETSTANITSISWSSSPDLGSVYAPFMPAMFFGIPNGVGASSHGLSTGHKVVIALGTLFGCAFLAGMLILLYILVHRGQPTRRLQFGMLQRYRVRRRRSKNSSKHSSMVGLTEEPDDITSMELDYVPSLDTKSAVRARRDSGWKNFEDYDYDD